MCTTAGLVSEKFDLSPESMSNKHPQVGTPMVPNLEGSKILYCKYFDSVQNLPKYTILPLPLSVALSLSLGSPPSPLQFLCVMVAVRELSYNSFQGGQAVHEVELWE